MEEKKELIRKYIPSFRIETKNYDRECYYLIYVDNILIKTCGNDISTYLSGMVDAILLLRK